MACLEGAGYFARTEQARGVRVMSLDMPHD